LLIRPATPADIPDLIALDRQSASAAHWDRTAYDLAFAEAGPPRTVLVVEKDGTVAGFVIARIIESDWEIENVVVSPAEQRAGLGSMLLRSLLEQARLQKASAIFLEVRESNAAARAAYSKAGFCESGRRTSYYQNPAEDAVLYRLDNP
jgi:ribosomal-protein-alanine acetyltransferase